jgi:hypothetical protein
MGYAAIVTSSMFGIASYLDRSTQIDLEKQRFLASQDELTDDEQAELDAVNDRLDRLGFRFFVPDDEYSRYLRIRSDELVKMLKTRDAGVIASRVSEMTLEDREALARRIIPSLIQEDGDTDA